MGKVSQLGPMGKATQWVRKGKDILSGLMDKASLNTF